MYSIAMEVRRRQPDSEAAGRARTAIERLLAPPAWWVVG
jgi:hypothetical protein